MRIVLLGGLFILSLFAVPHFVLADDPAAPAFSNQVAEKIPVSVFVRDDCKHCKDEKEFLSELQAQESDLDITYYNLDTVEGRALFNQITELEKIAKVTPITLVGNVVLQGFDTAATTGKRILELIVKGRTAEAKLLSAPEYIAQGGSGGKVETVEGGTCDENSTTCAIDAGAHKELLISIPLIGAINLYQYSLPTLAVVLGFVDGFNPCAMWVLLMFLIVLIEVGSRKKMWQVAGLFILAEAVMYYLILNVWFTAWDFIGLNRVVTPIVGLVAIGGGVFFLYEFMQKGSDCKIISPTRMKKTKDRISGLVQTELTFLVALGILGLAFSVNMIEFACSIGIPQAFTKIIELNGLSWLQTQAMMAIYILFYMVDDIIVFGIALYSFERLGVTTKYVKASNLIGGMLMLILGALLIFNPEALVF